MFIIFSCPRSGSTLLIQCLHAHGEIATQDEPDFVMPVAFVLRRVKDPQSGRKLIADIIPRTERFKLTLGEHLTEEEIRDIIFSAEYSLDGITSSIFRVLATKENKKISGYKNPDELQYADFLEHMGLFSTDDIKIIHLVRDVRDVTASIVRLGWLEKAEFFPQSWNNMNLSLHALMKDQPSRYMVVRYEDLVSDPEEILSGVCGFLGVDFRPEMLIPSRREGRHKGGIHCEHLYDEISRKNIGRHKVTMAQDIAAKCAKSARNAMKVFGYLEPPETIGDREALAKMGVIDRPMFFVFGSPQSGTELMADCLSAHDDLMVPSDTDFIIPMAFTFDRINDRETGRKVIEKFVTESEFYESSLDGYVSKEELLQVIRVCDYNPAEILRAIYGLVARKAGKKMGGDKSPNDLLFLRMLVKVGGIAPDTRIIHVVRDVRDMMVSITRLGMGGPDIGSYFARFWANSNLYLHNLYKDQPERYCLVRYEDLVADPEPELKAVSKVLGVEYQDKMLSPIKSGRKAEAAAGSVPGDMIGVYKEVLDGRTIRLYEEQAGEALDVFGFDRGGWSGIFRKLFQ